MNGRDELLLIRRSERSPFAKKASRTVGNSSRPADEQELIPTVYDKQELIPTVYDERELIPTESLLTSHCSIRVGYKRSLRS
jgi:hypothetical protein